MTNEQEVVELLLVEKREKLDKLIKGVFEEVERHKIEGTTDASIYSRLEDLIDEFMCPGCRELRPNCKSHCEYYN